FQETKLLGSNFTEAAIKNTKFAEWQANYAAFNQATGRYVIFSKTSLVDAEFQAVNWKILQLTQCDLERLNLLHTHLQQLDVKDCIFQHLLFSTHLLKDIIINPLQASAICDGLGVVIDE